LAPWLGALAGGLLLIAVGALGLRRSRRTAVLRELPPGLAVREVCSSGMSIHGS
jgi:hypothetical protein